MSSPLSLLLTCRMASSFNYYSSQDSNKHFPSNFLHPSRTVYRNASNRILKKWGRLQFFLPLSYLFLILWDCYFFPFIMLLWLLISYHALSPYSIQVYVRMSMRNKSEMTIRKINRENYKGWVIAMILHFILSSPSFSSCIVEWVTKKCIWR